MIENEDLLIEVKKRLLISDDFHNDLFLGLIEDVKNYMISAGVQNEVVNGVISIGCIARGVSDLWTSEKFSDFFNQRVIQLSCEVVNND